MSLNATLRCRCGENRRTRTFSYDAPPEGETKFRLKADYWRSYDSCDICGHWFGVHDLDLSAIYDKEYADATYGGYAGMAARFEQIMSLPETASDNKQRVRRVRAYAKLVGIDETLRPSLLDVGAGLGVFPAAMAAKGWRTVSLEPDARTVLFLRNVAAVDAILGDIRSLDPSEIGTFAAVTFNKVLEHVEDPVELLAASRAFISPGGFAYLEVPDVAAAVEGPGREEFFVEHHHVFTPASTAHLCELANLKPMLIGRLREPSSKFTIYAFCAPR